MNSAYLGSFPLTYPLPCKFLSRLHTKHQPNFPNLCVRGANLSSSISLASKSSLVTLPRATDSNIDAPVSFSDEGDASFIPIEEIIEKDWSVLDSGGPSIDRIISSGKIEESSRVLVSTASEEFVDSLVGFSPFKSLLLLHDSLLTLACIKERHDKVKCWQGEVTIVPEKWGPFDVVFLYFLPALPFKLEDILGSLAIRCSPGKFSLLQVWNNQFPLIIAN